MIFRTKIPFSPTLRLMDILCRSSNSYNHRQIGQSGRPANYQLALVETSRYSAPVARYFTASLLVRTGGATKLGGMFAVSKDKRSKLNAVIATPNTKGVIL